MTPDQVDVLTNEASSLEKITNILGWLNVVFVVSAALVAIATFYYSDKLSKVKDKIADLRIADANAKAAKANEGVSRATAKIEESRNKQSLLALEVSEARQRQALAEEKQIKSQIELVKLQEHLKPRILSRRQRIELIAILSHSVKGIYLATYEFLDDEAKAYSNQIIDALETAGWEKYVYKGGLVRGPEGGRAGIIILTNPNERGLVQANILKSAFRKVGIAYTDDLNQSVPLGVVKIAFCNKNKLW